MTGDKKSACLSALGKAAYEQTISCTYDSDFPTIAVEENENYGDYWGFDNVITVSSSENTSFEQYITTTLHEAGHALVAFEGEVFSCAGDAGWTSGMAWSDLFLVVRKPYYDDCPEEALVRSMAAFGVELISPDSREAAREALIELDIHYSHMNTARQFRECYLNDPVLETESKDISGQRDRYRAELGHNNLRA